jgi:hypothetical protein
VATGSEDFTSSDERPSSKVLEAFELSTQEFDELYKDLAK